MFPEYDDIYGWRRRQLASSPSSPYRTGLSYHYSCMDIYGCFFHQRRRRRQLASSHYSCMEPPFNRINIPLSSAWWSTAEWRRKLEQYKATRRQTQFESVQEKEK